MTYGVIRAVSGCFYWNIIAEVVTPWTEVGYYLNLSSIEVERNIIYSMH